MAKLIIEGELLQLLKIQKAQRSLVAKHIVTCLLEENKDQGNASSPESKTLPKEVEQINEEFEAKEESVHTENKVKEVKVKQEPVSPKAKVNIQKSKGRPAKK